MSSSSLSRRKLYRSRSKRSLCKKAKSYRKCNRLTGCKYTSKGTKRKFCRKKHNTRRQK